MSILERIKQLGLAGLGMLGRAVGVKPYPNNLHHIGPAHQYDTFGHCYRCPRYDSMRQLYTEPPCPRTYAIDPLE